MASQPQVTRAGEGVHAHHLVAHETVQVSVDNTGMIHPAPLIRPQDVDELIVALRKAKEVGLEQQALNKDAQAEADERIETQRAAAAEALRRHRSNAEAPPRRRPHAEVEDEEGGPMSAGPSGRATRTRKAAVSRAAKKAPVKATTRRTVK